MKQKRSNFGWLVLMMGIIGIVLLCGQFKTCDEFQESYTSKKELSGIIVKKFLDPQNHDGREIELSDGNTFTLINGLADLWEVIEVGDSIHKTIGSLEFAIYRSDTVIKMLPNCK